MTRDGRLDGSTWPTRRFRLRRRSRNSRELRRPGAIRCARHARRRRRDVRRWAVRCGRSGRSWRICATIIAVLLVRMILPRWTAGAFYLTLLGLWRRSAWPFRGLVLRPFRWHCHLHRHAGSDSLADLHRPAAGVRQLSRSLHARRCCCSFADARSPTVHADSPALPSTRTT